MRSTFKEYSDEVISLYLLSDDRSVTDIEIIYKLLGEDRTLEDVKQTLITEKTRREE
jgi:hypothetical protein